MPLFFRPRRSYKGFMMKMSGWGARLGAMLNENKGGPWGSGGGGGSGGGSGGGGPRNPWGQPPRRPRPGGGNVTSLDEFLKKSKARFGSGMPQGDGRPYWLYGLGIAILLWLAFTSVHRIGPQEAGVITRFGKYAGSLEPGIGFSLPSPIDRVQKVDVQEIRTIDVGSTDSSSENLILTGDQNIIDLAYSIRWNISDPELFLFQIKDTEQTIREAGESAMRAVVAGVTLDEAIGAGRGEIEQRVSQVMQQLLNDYRAGVKAQGESAAFDKVYIQYKLAPEVTRRRMYYETMEKVLSKVDKTVVEAPGVTPYLALPEIQKRAAPASEGAAR
jgi:membrane protease subunit HflK